MYHHVSPAAMVPMDAPPDDGWWWWHEPDALARHIITLRRRGHTIVSLDDYGDAIGRLGRAARTAVVLTFDDGWRDNYEYAVPVLRSLDAPATFFVTTEHINHPLSDPRRMNAQELKDLQHWGMTIGGHTRTHRALPGLSNAELESEVAGCRQDLKDVLGRSADWFAYPRGVFDRRTVGAVRAAGWRGAASALGPGRTTHSDFFWMFREVPGTDLRCLRDRARLSPIFRRLWALRTRQRLSERLTLRDGQG